MLRPKSHRYSAGKLIFTPRFALPPTPGSGAGAPEPHSLSTLAGGLEGAEPQQKSWKFHSLPSAEGTQQFIVPRSSKGKEKKKKRSLCLGEIIMFVTHNAFCLVLKFNWSYFLASVTAK